MIKYIKKNYHWIIAAIALVQLLIYGGAVNNYSGYHMIPVTEALGISRLIQLRNLSQEQAAKLLGKSQSAVANKLRLLRHSPEVLRAIREGQLTERHARALLKLESEPDKLMAISQILRHGLSVAKTEDYIQQLLSGKTEKSPRRVNIGGFLNHLDHTMSRFQSAGIGAVSERRETEKEIVVTITIPK